MNERAAGFAVYFIDDGEPLYLLLRSSGDGYWGFPKGKLDSGESNIQAAGRELVEETGIVGFEKPVGFELDITYQFTRGKEEFHKTVRYYLARVSSRDVKISSEHSEYGWFPVEDARRLILFDNLRWVLDEAHSFIQAQR
jgi:8-oxo-dGTP pyrophosphatase MutT (NUDIX family)